MTQQSHPGPDSSQHTVPSQDRPAWALRSPGSKRREVTPGPTPGTAQQGAQGADPQDICLAQTPAQACTYFCICNFISFFFLKGLQIV